MSILPRPINESQTIPIKLKRRLAYKHHYQFQNVRPSKVLEAAQYLVCTSDIFKNEGIQVMDNYVSNSVDNDEEWAEFIATDISKNASDNQSNDLNSEIEESIRTQISNDTIDMTLTMSGVKQMNNHQVLWIHYYKNQTLLKMVIK